MSHPYYPKDLSIPDYVPNLKSQLELFLIMGGVFVCLAAVFYRLGQSSGSPLKFIWFMICGLLHCGFELYYALNVGYIAGQNNLLAQLWKEYAKGDSRYVIYDTSLLALEIMTIIIYGPLCFLTAYTIWIKSSKQYFFQLVVSMCHLLSCTLYFLTELPDAAHCHPAYFWGYFLSMNAPWIIVPLLWIVQSYKHINRAFENRIKTE
ncbi:Emopamil-binding protein [Rhizopus microsporus var. microsporus]|uniref:Emopamil-binding protein n=2 Tax=Rhizopus microsporus TaxID=58291 RepID=A0A2G4SGP5_RHIZD|nr:Emopamil-binding protein [Rhizopus microsporus ATCC 52813]ORE11053.1 Emopamil-binding protein [Rhizopus microsporus var. microsporus]PHZ07940.1 Emopamil-binding protein [Rhizopus microsporus ATCC 52813]